MDIVTLLLKNNNENSLQSGENLIVLLQPILDLL